MTHFLNAEFHSFNAWFYTMISHVFQHDPNPKTGIRHPGNSLDRKDFTPVTKRDPCRHVIEYCLSHDTLKCFAALNTFLTPFFSRALIRCTCTTWRKKNNCNPSTSGSTAIRLLMKSHPIAVSSDHRGVFGALTGPMRAPIWPCPHESEWAVQW